MTIGPLAPLYAAEVCTDVALGMVMITEDIVVLLQDFVTPVLLQSPMQPIGVFFMFGFFSLIGAFWIYFYVPETKGLSTEEKKELFMPGAIQGRDLKVGEDCKVGIEHRSDSTIHLEAFRQASFIISGVKSAHKEGNVQRFADMLVSNMDKLGPMLRISEASCSDSATSESVSDKEHELDKDMPGIKAKLEMNRANTYDAKMEKKKKSKTKSVEDDAFKRA